MANSSAIEWTDATWNFLKGCTPVSAGCLNCYAASVAHQKQSNPNEKIAAQFSGLTVLKRTRDGQRPVFNGRINVVEHLIDKPLHWREPKRIFVNSLSDLFHEDVPTAVIDRAFAVMALAQQHTFQILTKRPERMSAYCSILPMRFGSEAGATELLLSSFPGRLFSISQIRDVASQFVRGAPHNVWCGTSVEDQKAADERIPELLRTRAAVRFLSCEPLLGPVNLESAAIGIHLGAHNGHGRRLGVDWVIAGGESGPHSRPMNIDWVRALVRQCRNAGVAVFVKQLGAHPYLERSGTLQQRLPGGGTARLTAYELEMELAIRDPKGGNWAEWPADLRVREFPEVAR